MSLETKSKSQLPRIVLTGGAGGIGRALTKNITAVGRGRLWVTDIDAQSLNALKANMEGNWEIEAIVGDIRDDGFLTSLASKAETELGGIDLLINNAGVMTGHSRQFDKNTLQEINRTIDINLTASAKLISLCWNMLSRSNGCVLNIASGAGKIPVVSDPVYSASKAAMIMLTKAMAADFKRSGIRHNAICPGVVDTGILRHPETGEFFDDTKGFMSKFDLLKPEHIAETALFLWRDGNSNGETPVIMNNQQK